MLTTWVVEGSTTESGSKSDCLVEGGILSLGMSPKPVSETRMGDYRRATLGSSGYWRKAWERLWLHRSRVPVIKQPCVRVSASNMHIACLRVMRETKAQVSSTFRMHIINVLRLPRANVKSLSLHQARERVQAVIHRSYLRSLIWLSVIFV